MTKSLVTVRTGATISHIHDPALAGRWLQHLIGSAGAGQHEDDIQKRLSVVEASLRVQHAVGASHLQQIEQAPSVFGLCSTTRPALRALRRQRNAALHKDFGQERATHVSPSSSQVASPCSAMQLVTTSADSQPGTPIQDFKGDRATDSGDRPGQVVKLHLEHSPTFTTDADKQPSVDSPGEGARPGQVKKLPPRVTDPPQKIHLPAEASSPDKGAGPQQVDSGAHCGGRPGQVEKLPPVKRSLAADVKPADEKTTDDKSADEKSASRPGQVGKLPPSRSIMSPASGRPGQVVKLPLYDVPAQPNFDDIAEDLLGEDLGEGEDLDPLPGANDKSADHDKSADVTSMPITRSENEPVSCEGGRPGQVVKLPPQHADEVSADDMSADDSVEERSAKSDDSVEERRRRLVSDIVGRQPESDRQAIRDLLIKDPARFHQLITDYWHELRPLRSEAEV